MEVDTTIDDMIMATVNEAMKIINVGFQKRLSTNPFKKAHGKQKRGGEEVVETRRVRKW